MSGDRNSDNSLNRELAYEDITIAAGESSKRKRQKAKEEKQKKAEDDKQEQTKEVMFRAGENSRTKRGNK